MRLTSMRSSAATHAILFAMIRAACSRSSLLSLKQLRQNESGFYHNSSPCWILSHTRMQRNQRGSLFSRSACSLQGPYYSLFHEKMTRRFLRDGLRASCSCSSSANKVSPEGDREDSDQSELDAQGKKLVNERAWLANPPMVYTWDGDLMPRDVEWLGAEGEFSLGDGEAPMYTEDGDEHAYHGFPWEISGGVDSWDTYDTNFVDPIAETFADRAKFRIPDTFDWNKTTNYNYAAPAKKENFHGVYKHVRSVLDYSYHVNYIEERQRLQDEIVRYWCDSGVRSDRPWIIFTAGAMGAGKSRTISQLEANGVDTLRLMVKSRSKDKTEHCVQVDPDTVKYQLPEMKHYISRNPGPNPNKNIILAGHATHNESGFLQEVIVRKLMEGSKHLIVDGSLSNAEWYREYLMQIRTKYPHYRIGIIHVMCDREIIWERVQQRCIRTGRCISWQVVDLSVEMSPKAVELLTPLTDFVAIARSDGDIEDKELVFTHLRNKSVLEDFKKNLGDGVEHIASCNDEIALSFSMLEHILSS